ncbi:hypothetical protein RRG08_036584 [Elysia crispata]|uniref:Uncharacterized protein n=1 Tax=Elysia crispata TaxID=231223 RepID=A0AAE1DKB4_9GAST|nr:hypothetical protein RRG08_036584 [Elysia crispata]
MIAICAAQWHREMESLIHIRSELLAGFSPYTLYLLMGMGDCWWCSGEWINLRPVPILPLVDSNRRLKSCKTELRVRHGRWSLPLPNPLQDMSPGEDEIRADTAKNHNSPKPQYSGTKPRLDLLIMHCSARYKAGHSPRVPPRHFHFRHKTSSAHARA